MANNPIVDFVAQCVNSGIAIGDISSIDPIDKVNPTKVVLNLKSGKRKLQTIKASGRQQFTRWLTAARAYLLQKQGTQPRQSQSTQKKSPRKKPTNSSLGKKPSASATRRRT